MKSNMLRMFVSGSSSGKTDRKPKEQGKPISIVQTCDQTVQNMKLVDPLFWSWTSGMGGGNDSAGSEKWLGELLTTSWLDMENLRTCFGDTMVSFTFGWLMFLTQSMASMVQETMTPWTINRIHDATNRETIPAWGITTQPNKSYYEFHEYVWICDKNIIKLWSWKIKHRLLIPKCTKEICTAMA